MSNNWKKPTACCLLLVMLLAGLHAFLLPARTDAQEAVFTDLEAHAAVLLEYHSGEVLFAQNAEEPLPPASLTKIMTLLVAYEALDEGRTTWDELVTISERSWATGGSQMFLEIGQQVPMGELIAGIATISANDACVAIAEHLYGSEELFVQAMNRTARELGLVHTHFTNASGLPHPEHYASAMDLARLAHHFIQNYPESLALHAQKEFTFNEILQYNRNPLLGRYPGADGLKTGHTEAAGYCLVGTAAQQGMRFIAVVMNAPSNAARQNDTETMFNYAFRTYTLHRIFDRGEHVDSVKVAGGQERYVEVKTDGPVEVVVSALREDDVQSRIETLESIPARVEIGTPAGHVEVILDDRILQRVSLSAADEVERAGRISLFFRALGDFFANLWWGFTDWLKEIIPLPME